MRRVPGLAVALAAVLLTASACGLSSDGAASTSASGTSTVSTTASPGAGGSSGTGSRTASGTPSPAPSTGRDAALPDDLRTRPAVVAALADTAGRERVAPEAVVIAGWSPVTWNDGSVGCPEKGRAYTQALVDGELLLLRVGTRLFQYHAVTDGPFTYCADPTAGYTVGS